MFLFRNFLTGNNKIHQPLNIDRISQNQIPRTLNSHITRLAKHNTLKETLNKMPVFLKEIVGTINLPSDNGRQLAETIKSDRLLGASNGSLQGKEDGGYAFSIQ